MKLRFLLLAPCLLAASSAPADVTIIASAPPFAVAQPTFVGAPPEISAQSTKETIPTVPEPLPAWTVLAGACCFVWRRRKG